jgi:hypothetical protein
MIVLSVHERTVVILIGNGMDAARLPALVGKTPPLQYAKTSFMDC